MDLIDRAAMIASASKYRYAVRRDSHPYEALKIQGEAFRKMVDEAPAIDAVPVVRCEKCEKRGELCCPMCTTLPDGRIFDFSLDDGYCDRGERKEDE